MVYPLRKRWWCAALTIVLGCAGAPSKWEQFHGDLASQGFQLVDSGFALSAAWISEPYEITSSSPVLGKSVQGKEVLYVGTINGHLIAIDTADGSEKWDCYLGDGGVTAVFSTPAVSDKGDIYVIANDKIRKGHLRSTLQKVDQSGKSRWLFTFPDNGFTSGSPKVITTGGQTLLFVYVLVERGGAIQGELFVVRDDNTHAQLLDRKTLGDCRDDSVGSDTQREDLFDFLEETWIFLTAFPVHVDVTPLSFPDTFVDPTVAIKTDRPNLLVGIADNLCSIGAYEWNGINLSVLWRETHDSIKHSSPALLANGLMVFGNKDGEVLAYDAQTGAKMWHYDAGEPVLAAPAAPPGQFVFLVSKNHLQAVQASDGTLIFDGTSPRMVTLHGQTHASPAVTANRVYVSTWEMLTVTHDLKTRGHDTNFRGNGLSSIAVSSRGNVYAIDSDGRIHKYLGAK